MQTRDIPLMLRRLGLALLLGSSLALGGCASVMLVDNEVQTYPRWADRAGAIPQAPQVFRFERTPSREGGRAGASQDMLERLAVQSLARAGWTPAAGGVGAAWSVEVNAMVVQLPRAPWESPYDSFHGPFGPRWIHPYGPGYGFHGPVFPRLESPYYQRRVTVLVRNAANGQVVYESSAAHDGRWNGTESLWQAMLDAALQGFPNPREGRRRVDIEVPR
ncbi:DUF4136 domain-containing protein [uncultured Hydrogenophaga sp.]|uniref:DUF4136 domain-containing protein n=1 Tax=uncultured Hydrogenophaga sp. TaxID=199683 RepID=UPI00265F1304|nr:hypothetical protein [uncultured Hydrogenophaga sp.]